MPVICRFRPNRTKDRPFTERSAAKIICKVVRSGGSKALIDRLYLEVCPDVEERPDDAAESEALAVAEQALVQNNEMLTSDTEILQRMLQVLGILAAIGRFIVQIPIPAAKAVGGLSVALNVAARARLDQIAVQRAANDAALAIVRRAAANAASFRKAA